MKVTIKGQVTIPLALRERFNLQPGTEVEFIPGKQALEIKPRDPVGTPSKAFDLWLSKAAGSAKAGVTTDQHLAITRGED
ncbi:MAG: AbrB/MazE/SpoVT family DNA-binding domain-containing protein [Luteolibacter sp.]|jgi:AbrB family looped-hinge helix DNA binding protein